MNYAKNKLQLNENGYSILTDLYSDNEISKVFDRIFKQISIKLHQRDFILYLRNSDEIDNHIRAKNPHVKRSDILFSVGLLLIIVGTIFIGIKVFE